MKSKFDEPFSKTVFWLALPFLLFFIGSLFYFAIASGRGLSTFMGLSLVCVPVVCFGFVLYDTKRFWWARRVVALAVFLMYLNYADMQLHSTPNPMSLRVLNAGASFFLVGLPALIYFFRGAVAVDASLLLWQRVLSPLAKINIGKKRKQPPVKPERRAKEDQTKWYQ